MSRYILRRLAFLVPVLGLLSILSFGLLIALPGDPLDMLALGDPSITQADIKRLKELYGLNDPLPVRYAKWMGQVLQGNLGYSRHYKVPVTELLGPRLGNTLVLTGLAIVVSLAVSIPIGVYSAVRPYSPGDYAVTILAFVGYAVPAFWLGLVLIIIFAVHFGWFPAGGIVSPDPPRGLISALTDRGSYLVMPVVVLSLHSLATWTRYMRSSLLEVVHQDFIRTAHAKGLAERAVIYRHALKNALIPMVTLLANTVPVLIGGSVIVETVFAYPGIGKMHYDSVLGNDYSVSMAILMLLALLVAAFNLLADITYGLLDPRIRYE
ncbi:MAG: ABC transporter permease [Armatimonadota bacterium]